MNTLHAQQLRLLMGCLGLPAENKEKTVKSTGRGRGRPSLRMRPRSVLLLDANKTHVCPTAPANEPAVPLTKTSPRGDGNRERSFESNAFPVSCQSLNIQIMLSAAWIRRIKGFAGDGALNIILTSQRTLEGFIGARLSELRK